MSSSDGATRFVEPGADEGAVLVISAFMIMVLTSGLWYTNGIYITIWMDYFKTGSGLTSWLGTVLPGASIIMSPVLNILIRRFGLRMICPISFALTGLAIALSSMAQTFYIMLVIWLFAGVTLAAHIYIFSYILTRFRKYRSLVNGFVTIGPSVGNFLFPLIINFILNEYGWRGSILIISGIILHLVPFSLLLRNWKHTKNKNQDILLPPTEVKVGEENLMKTSKYQRYKVKELVQIDLFKKRVFNAIMIHTFFYYMNVSLIYVHIVAGSRDLLGLTTIQATLTLTYVGIGNFVGRLLVSLLAQIPRVDVFTLYLITCLLVCATAGVFPWFKGFDAAMVLSALFGLGLAGYGVLLQLVLMDLLGVNCLHMAFSYIQLTGGIGYVLGAPLAGWLYDYADNYAYSFYLGTCIVGISVLALIPDWFIHIRRRSCSVSRCPTVIVTQ